MLRFLAPVGKYNKKKYNKFVKWSFASNILASTQQTISSHSVLVAINPGGVSEITRTINYVGKDVIGQIGGMMYIAKIGHNADKNPRDFLVKSNIVQQSSLACTTALPIIGNELFLPIAGVSSILTNISFIGFGSINARCIQSLAEDSNIGEIYAKISIINTIGSSIGMIAGIYISYLLPDPESRLFIVPLLGIGRCYTYNKAVQDFIN